MLHEYEAVEVTMKMFAEVHVHPTYSHNPSRRSQQRGTKQKQKSSSPNPCSKGSGTCKWCGGQGYNKSDCPAQGAICHFCTRKRHCMRKCISQTKAKLYFAHNTEEGDTSVAVAVTAVALVFVESYYLGIAHVCWHCTFSSAQTDQLL